MSSLTSLVTSSALAFTVPLEAIAPLLGIFILMVGLVLAAGLARAWFARYQNEFASDDQMVMIQITGFASVSLSTVRDYPSATANAVASMLQLLTESPAVLFTIIVFFLAGTLWNSKHTAIAAALLRVQQCGVLPIINDIVLPIANFVRLLFDAVWPLVSLGSNYYQFAMSGWYKILKKCAADTIEAHADDLFNQVAVVAHALADAIVTFFAGDIFTDRILLTNLLTQIGLFANFLLPFGSCFCAWFDPIWVFYTSIPQMQALHTAIDAAVNAVLRLLQIVLNTMTEVEAPFWSTLFEELILLAISAGETVEQAAILVLDLLTDLINQIGLVAENDPEAVRTLFGLPLKYDENGQVVPPTLSQLYHAAGNSKLSASSFATPQRELGAALRGPIWNLPNSTNVTDLLGFPVILALLQTPWSHAGTELVAGALIIVNMTLNIVSNPVAIFSTPTIALSYFQVGPVFDRLKAAWDAASQLLVIIDPNFPDAVSFLGQALATYWEALAELIIGAIAAIIWPRWSFGEPPPTDCSAPGSCGYPADDWTFFNIFPDYYDWQNNALRRTLVLLNQDADAIAVLLGCNDTTISDDDCTAMPFQCAIRTAQLTAVEAVNQTLAFIFYLPDLAQFDYPLKTFDDLNPARLQELFYLFIECLTTWYALFHLEKARGEAHFPKRQGEAHGVPVGTGGG